MNVDVCVSSALFFKFYIVFFSLQFAYFFDCSCFSVFFVIGFLFTNE